MSRDLIWPRDQWIIWHYGWVLLKFDIHRRCSREDSLFLVYQVTSSDHVIRTSCDIWVSSLDISQFHAKFCRLTLECRKMTDAQWLHHSLFILQEKLTLNFHMRYNVVSSVSTFHWFSNKHDGKQTQENVKIRKIYHYKMCFSSYYNMKFILPCPYIKLHNEICSTSHNAQRVSQ